MQILYLIVAYQFASLSIAQQSTDYVVAYNHIEKMEKSFNKQQELIPIIVNDFNLVSHPFNPQVYGNYSFLVNNQNKKRPRTQEALQKVNQRKKGYFLKKCIKTICDRYFINYFQQDLDRVVDKIKEINKIQGTGKGLLETTAAVVLGEYWEHIRCKTTKQFCSINGLSTNVFNLKYKAYQRIYGPDSKKEKRTNQNQQQIYQLEIQKQTNLPQMKENDQLCSINNPTLAISLIYDLVFKRDYFLLNRRTVIQKFTNTFDKLDSRVIKEADWLKYHVEKIYHVFCAILRYAKSYIKFKDVRNAVQKKFGYMLYKKDCEEVWKIFKKYKDSEEKIDNYYDNQMKNEDQILPISDVKTQE